MGNVSCCGSQNIDAADKKKAEDAPELSAMQKIAMIIKIQAAYRGKRDRKKVQKIREGRKGRTTMMAHSVISVGATTNYDNEEV